MLLLLLRFLLAFTLNTFLQRNDKLFANETNGKSSSEEDCPQFWTGHRNKVLNDAVYDSSSIVRATFEWINRIISTLLSRFSTTITEKNDSDAAYGMNSKVCELNSVTQPNNYRIFSPRNLTLYIWERLCWNEMYLMKSFGCSVWLTSMHLYNKCLIHLDEREKKLRFLATFR